MAVELFHNPRSWGSFKPEVDDPNFEVQRKAFGSLVLFALSSSAATSEYDLFSRTVKELSFELFNYTYGAQEEVQTSHRIASINVIEDDCSRIAGGRPDWPLLRRYHLLRISHSGPRCYKAQLSRC